MHLIAHTTSFIFSCSSNRLHIESSLTAINAKPHHRIAHFRFRSTSSTQLITPSSQTKLQPSRAQLIRDQNTALCPLFSPVRPRQQLKFPFSGSDVEMKTILITVSSRLLLSSSSSTFLSFFSILCSTGWFIHPSRSSLQLKLHSQFIVFLLY